MKKQRGGFVLGLIIGLLTGLALALGVALYIAKVPVPFVNKVPQRTAEQDAAETEKNKNWNPNAGLHGKNPARPGSVASGTVSAASASDAPAPASAPRKDGRDPASILAGKEDTAASSTKSGAGALITYFVQAGAYGSKEDAEQQRGRVALLGLSAKITEREQAGRTIFRVRLGPFESKDEATSTKDKLDGAGVESALVQVQK